MEEQALTGLTEYGVLGLWTISLMWREHSTEKRHQSQIDRMEERHQEATKRLEERHEEATRDFLAMREKIHADIVDELKEISHKLDISLNKINDGLTAMREKYAEDRAWMRNQRGGES